MSPGVVLVTGAGGLLGSALRSVAAESRWSFRFVDRRDGDLRERGVAEGLLEAGGRPDCVIHAAAHVGGIEENRRDPEAMYEDNARMDRNVLEAALRLGVPKVVAFLSTCIFHPGAPQPWNEKMIHEGEPDQRHWGYARAKRELDLLARDLTARAQGSSRFVTLMPSTLYGPGDDFHPERSHVLPAILLKMWRARETGGDVTLWGTGAPRRELLFSVDMARVALWAADDYDEVEPLIVSPSADVSIRDLAQVVAGAIGFRGRVVWDAERPDGTPSRRTSSAKLRGLVPGLALTPLQRGIETTAAHFRAHYPSLRGLVLE